MATWHQQKARARLDHPTQWSVVYDPPNDVTTIRTFETEEAAKTFLSRFPAHSFILPPRKG